MSAICSSKRNEWVLAAEELILRSKEHVLCPECRTPALQVRDVEYGWGPHKGLDRYLSCSHCGSYNSVTLRRAAP